MTLHRKRWIWIGTGLAVLVAVALVALPEVARRVAIKKIAAATGRDVAIEDIDFNLFTRRLAVKAFRLADRDRPGPFVQFDQLNLRLHLLPLFRGHLKMVELSLLSPVIGLRRTGPNEFNFSDLLAPSEEKQEPKAKGGFDVTVGRFNLVGGAVIFEDFALTPNRTWKAEGIAIEVEDLSTRSDLPGGTASVSLTLAGTPISLKASDLRVLPANGRAKLGIQGFDLALLLPYLPPDAPATLQSGRVSASLTIGHGAQRGTQVDGDIQFENLSALQHGRSSPFLSVPALAIALKELTMLGGELAVGRVEVAGNPSLFDTNIAPVPRFDLKKLKIDVESVTWPARSPARVRVASGLPKGGSLEVQGAVHLNPLKADLRVALKGADITPYQPYIPISAPLSGKAEADLTVVASIDGGLKATVRGKGSLSRIGMGPQGAPVLAVEQASATAVDVRWPSHITVGRVEIRKPSALIERDESGALPLRAMFAPPTTKSPVKPEVAAVPVSQLPGPPPSKLAIEIGEVVIEEGYAQFIDRTGAPPYTEELSRLAVNIKGLSNAPGRRGRLALQSLIGATGALELQGEVAPLGESLFVDLEGELRDFAIPRVNPYTNRILAWIAREGRLATKLHFRVDGDKLDVKSEIVVGRLDLVQAGEGDEAQKRIGLPLGLIVALMKDVRGEIRVNVPVSGSLSAPEFSLGEAIWAAVRNVIINVLTAPFQLIGRLFTKDDKIAGLAIDPVRFDPGSGVLNEAMEQQLRRLGDFMRSSPFVSLGLSAVVSAADLESLKTQEVTARIQRFQREQQIADLAAAAGRMFRQKFPDRAIPKSVEEMVAALRDAEPTPEEAGRKLATRRLEVTRDRLIKVAGLDLKRLEPSEKSPAIPGQGEGRVDFEILP